MRLVRFQIDLPWPLLNRIFKKEEHLIADFFQYTPAIDQAQHTQNEMTEQLAEKIFIHTSKNHKFGTDAFLLADFAQIKSKHRCCDIGTGCGIIPMIWIKNNLCSRIYGIDIQADAIALCKKTIEQCKSLGNEFDFIPILQDIKDIAILKENIPYASLDVVCCNPPYKVNGAGIISHSPSDKIARHETMCDINDICLAASTMLKFGGSLCVCQRPERLADVMEAMRKNGIEPKKLRFASKNAQKPPWLFLLEGKKGSKPFMKVLPTLLTRNEDGTFTDEMLKIYGKM